MVCYVSDEELLKKTCNVMQFIWIVGMKKTGLTGMYCQDKNILLKMLNIHNASSDACLHTNYNQDDL